VTGVVRPVDEAVSSATAVWPRLWRDSKAETSRRHVWPTVRDRSRVEAAGLEQLGRRWMWTDLAAVEDSFSTLGSSKIAQNTG